MTKDQISDQCWSLFGYQTILVTKVRYRSNWLKLFTVADEIRREMPLLRRNVHCESIRATCEQENQCDCLKTKSEKRHFYRTAAICRPGYPICCNNTHISAKFDHWECFPSEKNWKWLAQRSDCDIRTTTRAVRHRMAIGHYLKLGSFLSEAVYFSDQRPK